MGYKTCHALNSSLDSTVCAKDCERLKKHKFAKDCKNKGGLYKCCIRRDKAFCHECRYQAQISGVRYKVSGSDIGQGCQITCPGSAAHYLSALIRPHTMGPMATHTVFLTSG